MFAELVEGRFAIMAQIEDVMVRIEWLGNKGGYARVEWPHCLNMNDICVQTFRASGLASA